jgi:hypothetical protein
MAQNRHRKKFNIYLLPQEAEDLKDKAHAMRMSFSEFVRYAATGQALPVANLIPPEQFRQLSTIGNNLNQIAKKLNSGGSAFPSQLSALTHAQNLLEEIRNRMRGQE